MYILWPPLTFKYFFNYPLRRAGVTAPVLAGNAAGYSRFCIADLHDWNIEWIFFGSNVIPVIHSKLAIAATCRQYEV
jgi:hypothetical protein